MLIPLINKLANYITIVSSLKLIVRRHFRLAIALKTPII